MRDFFSNFAYDEEQRRRLRQHRAFHGRSGGVGDPIAALLGTSEFYAPLTHSLILARGAGGPAFARFTSAWEFDNEGKLILVPSGAARFGGARMVRNLLTATSTLSTQNVTTVAASYTLSFHGTGSITLSGSATGTLNGTGVSTRVQTTVTATAGTLTLTVSGLVTDAQLENVTGQLDQTASEYVSVGVLSAPFHGAGVDGVKWFDTNKNGSAIPASSLLGYHGEATRMNNLLHSRDLTNAVWVKTNITAARTAVGIDNAANSASTLTASAANATILQTLTMAAAARSFSAYVKRRTGTGAVYITRNGGANWTDITSSLGASWARVRIENTSVLNPSVGFMIVAPGDAIDVDACQDEAGTFITSPIITTTAAVTRNADLLSYTEAANVNSAQGSFCFTCKMDDKSSAALYEARFCIRNSGTGTDNVITNYHAPPLATHTLEVKSGGANFANINDGVANTNLTQKVAGVWALDDVRYVTDGILRGSDTSVTPPLGLDQIQIGMQANSPSKTYIKNVYVWKSVLTTPQLQQVTT